MWFLYELRYVVNGVESSGQVRARTDAEALRLFREGWSEYGDPLPESVWVVGRWSVQ